MPKLTAVSIWGFQAHVDTRYELHPGLNVFTGPTDGGKTAATIRALRWLAKGEPSGEDFLFTVRDADGNIVRQADEAGVEVTLDNGVIVKKARRKGKTKYWVTGYDEPFEKAEVPEAVKQALGIESTVYSRDSHGKPDFEVDLHFAYQLAAPFLISEPGSAGAKVLGKLAGTEAVDGAIKATAKDTYTARQDKATADQDAEKAKKALKDYEDLDAVQDQLEAAEYLLGQIDIARATIDDLAELSLDLNIAQSDIHKAAEELDRLAVIPELEEDLRAIEKAQQRYDRLLDLYESLGKATDQVESLSQQLLEFAGIEAAEYLLTTASTTAEKADTLFNLNTEYQKRILEVNTASDILHATKDLDLFADDLDRIEQHQQRLSVMSLVSMEYGEAQAKVSQCERALAFTQGIGEAAVILLQVDTGYSRYIQLSELLRTFNIKDFTRQQAVEGLRKAQSELQDAERELQLAWQDTGGSCPLCGQELAHAH